MAGASFKFTIDDAALREMLARQTQPPTELLSQLGEYLLRSTQDRFKTQMAPDGTPWQALSPGYKKRKDRHRDKVLTLNGTLRNGIRYQLLGDKAVEVGTNALQGAIHQFGGVIGQLAQSRKMRFQSKAGRVLFASSSNPNAKERWVTRSAYGAKMPARPFLGISAEDDHEIRDIVQHWINARTQGR